MKWLKTEEVSDIGMYLMNYDIYNSALDRYDSDYSIVNIKNDSLDDKGDSFYLDDKKENCLYLHRDGYAFSLTSFYDSGVRLFGPIPK